MNTLRILQLGDIHYPDAHREGPIADVKDKAMATPLVEAATANRLEEVTRRISELKSRKDFIAALLICGDLTSRGDISGYEQCLV